MTGGRRAVETEGPGSFAGAMTGLSLGFLAAGIAWPEAAEVFLRTLLVTLALAWIVFRAVRSELPGTTTHDGFSPFRGHEPSRAPPATPEVLRSLARDLEAADDPELARRKLIPLPVQRTLTDEAARRLSEGHGLDLDDPAHHAAIRSRVSETTWFLIRPPDPAAGVPSRRRPDDRPVPLGRLDLIFDDLEKL